MRNHNLMGSEKYIYLQNEKIHKIDQIEHSIIFSVAIFFAGILTGVAIWMI